MNVKLIDIIGIAILAVGIVMTTVLYTGDRTKRSDPSSEVVGGSITPIRPTERPHPQGSPI